MEMLSGAEMVVRSLIDQGVKHVFGYPAGAVLDIYDALHTVGGIDHILVRHEQGAVHMADGYARATGEVGVVLVTSGPGATNAITGIATAYMDSIPMVVLSGQVPSSLIGYDAFQSAIWWGLPGGEAQLPGKTHRRHSGGVEEGVLRLPAAAPARW